MPLVHVYYAYYILWLLYIGLCLRKCHLTSSILQLVAEKVKSSVKLSSQPQPKTANLIGWNVSASLVFITQTSSFNNSLLMEQQYLSVFSECMVHVLEFSVIHMNTCAYSILCTYVFSQDDEENDQSLLANEQRREQMMAEQEALDNEVAYLREREEQIRNLEANFLTSFSPVSWIFSFCLSCFPTSILLFFAEWHIGYQSDFQRFGSPRLWARRSH